jgi:PKD repeat protein
MTATLRRTHPKRWVLFLLSAFLLLSPVLPAMPIAHAVTTTTLSGQVTGGQPPAPLASVAIDVLAQGTGSVVASGGSDTDGNYTVPNLTPDTYNVRVTPPPGSGYQATTLQSVDLTHDQVQNVSLTPSGPAPTQYQYTYHGKLLMGGQPFPTSNNGLGLQMTLKKTDGRWVAGPIDTDADGNYSFTYYTTTEPTAPMLQLVAHFSCRIFYCPDNGGSYSDKLPNQYSITANQPITFAVDNAPAIDLPVTHVTFNVSDPAGNPLESGASLTTKTASGTYEIAPGVTADWTAGDSSYGMFYNSFRGYVIPGATYAFQVSGTGYNPVPVTLAAIGSEMTQNVTVTDPAPILYTHTYHGKLLMGGEPFATSNNGLGLQMTLTKPDGRWVAGPVDTDSNGNFTFDYYTTTEPTAPELQLKARFTCRVFYCPDNGGSYSDKTPNSLTITAQDSITFTTGTTPTIDIPLTHITFNVSDPDGNPIPSGASLVTKTASGTLQLAPGVAADWTAGDSSYGMFYNSFRGYVMPGASYTFQVAGENYLPETVTVDAVPGEMTKAVTATTLAPVYHPYTYHGKLLIGGQPLSTSNNGLGLQMTLKKTDGRWVAGPIDTDADGNYSFTYYTTDTTAPEFQLVPHFTCRVFYCPDNGGSYSDKTPNNFTINGRDPILFTTDNQPVLNIPLTHITFNVLDTSGTPIDAGESLETKTASGTFELAPGVTADWTAGDSSYGMFYNSFRGYVIPGATYTFRIGTEHYLPVRVTLTATGSEMTQTVVMQPFTNNAPSIAPLAGAALPEGGYYSENGTFTDADSATWTGSVNYGDGSGSQLLVVAGNGFALRHTYSNNGTYTVSVTITDNQGATSTATTTVTITNAAPVITGITGPTSPLQTNSSATVSATFTDAGTADTHQATWSWGDGASSAASITETGGNGSISNPHTYTAAGVYPVTLTLTDSDGATTSRVFNYITVYNPTPQGLFSGGSHFDSPAGAVIGNNAITGKAKFGITAKYSGSQPTGDVKFNLPQANIDMVSTAVTVLVTANGIATVRGTATVNGTAGYTFLATGADSKVAGGTDGVRIQIKNPAGQTIYDTQPGAADTARPTIRPTGNITVH